MMAFALVMLGVMVFAWATWWIRIVGFLVGGCRAG